MAAADLDTYLSVLADQLGRNPGNLRFGMSELFRGVELSGRNVLDIGAGEGDASFYAACSGARRVVSLEPEAAGSKTGMIERFERIRELLGASQVELRPETLQQFDPGGERFDVLVSVASINHLNEDACIRLREDAEARTAYLDVLRKLADVAVPGADLVVADCARRNLFARLGVTNPLVPTIEWHKHQSPRLWAELLEQAGFGQPRIRWSAFNTLRRPGRVLLGNRVAAYVLTSTFTLTMRRSPE